MTIVSDGDDPNDDPRGDDGGEPGESARRSRSEGKHRGADPLETRTTGNEGLAMSDQPSAVAVADRPAPRRRSVGDVVRFFVSGVGQTLITIGLVLLLFVVYEVWVTNIFADRKQAKAHAQLQQQWDNGEDPLGGKTRLDLPSGEQVILPIGQGFANLYIPAFGKDFAKTIVEGVGDSQLEQGPGHYPKTAIPGQTGNFAIAGHRVGKGEPFLNLDQLKAGDALVMETADTWFIYTVLGDKATGDPTVQDPVSGLYGRQIVAPSAVSVIAPDPAHPDQTGTRKLITLTTCHPKYTANQRMIIHGELSREVARNGNALPTELGGTI